MILYNSKSEVINSVYDINGNPILNVYNSLGDLLSSERILKVMTFNVGLFSGINTTPVLTHIIDTYNVDIIGVQEAYTTNAPASMSSVFNNYPYRFYGSLFNKDALISKIKLESPVSTIFDYNTLETRAYSKTYITFNNIKVCWVNTHLETTSGGEAKVKQAQELFNAVKDEPYFIVTGDFNTICKSTDHTEYIKIIKPFLDIEAKSVNCTEERGFINTWTDSTIINLNNGYPTDHIIVSKTIDIKNVVFDYYKNDLNSSKVIDHIPIIAELIINN